MHRSLSAQLVQHVSRLVSEADHILVAAGAGLSADAGFDYAESEQFLQRYPYLRAVGVHTRYHSIGFRWPTKTMQLAFYARHLQDILYNPPPSPDPYLQLKAITEHADRWVLTSNADNLFPRMGFDPERLWTRQGTYARLQCLRPCCDEVWESAPYVDRILPKVDLRTGELTDDSLLPQCPRCGGEMMLNVRGGAWFVERPYQRQQENFIEWLGKVSTGRLVILEIGAGYSTPSVIRWPCETLAEGHPNAHLIRVNLHHPEAPDSLAGRSTVIAARGAAVLSVLYPQRHV